MSHSPSTEDYKRELAEIARFPEMNPGPVLRMNLEGKVLMSNMSAQQLFGHDLYDRNWLDICPHMTREIWLNILATSEVVPIERTMGDQCFLFNHRMDQNKFVFVFGTDITANKLNERKLEEQKQLIGQIALFPHMNPGPVVRMNVEGKVLMSNMTAQQIFGQDLVGKNWLTICPQMSKELYETILASDDVVPVERMVGERCFLFNHRTDQQNKFVFVFGTDITANKLNEKKLEEQKQVIEQIALFPHMNPGPVVRMDFEGNILLCNVTAQQLFGEDMLGKNWKNICPGITDKLWHKIISTEKVIPVEEQINSLYFVFNHRTDLKNKLVFVFGTDITLQRLAEKQLRQSEKMATLGTLAAGVAHELNNPAAATGRAAQQLRDLIRTLESIDEKLSSVKLSPAETDLMSVTRRAGEDIARKNNINALEISDREQDLEEWLDEYGIDNAWELTPSLVTIGLDKDILASKINGLDRDNVFQILKWISAFISVYELLNEINEGSSRISEIVVAMKNYSYLGQAPIQNVDIHEGINNTLVILKNKLKTGVTVHREFTPDLPLIMAYGSELNQVWTNILDNAVDAMKGKGEIIIRTRKENDKVVVEIEDNGPGIPEAVQSRIFDPFFTTKDPGKGTGLGLNTSYGIVTEKHQGTINVHSKPGSTNFIVRLPVHIATSSKNENTTSEK